MWTALRQDRAWWSYLALLTLVNFLYVPPLVERSVYLRLAPAVDPLASAGLLMVLLYGWRRIEDDAERVFWGLTTAAYGCWWLAETLMASFASQRGTVGFHLFIDGLYLLLFMLSLAAAEWRPDLERKSDASAPMRPRIELAGLLVALVSLAFYFVLIPSRLDAEHYSTWINSSMLYAVLDLLVALRYAQLSRRTRRQRWRVLYLLVALSMAIWFLLDTASALKRAGFFELPGQSPWNLFWTLPLLTMAAASSWRRFPPPEPPAERAPADAGEGEPLTGLYRSGSPLIVVAFLLPVMHSGLGALGLLLPQFQPARDWLVVVSLGCLGALLLIEQGSEQARARRERRRLHRVAARDLQHSEERFRTLAAATAEGVIIHDGETILDANEQLAAMFGFPLEQVIGAGVGDRVAPQDKARVRGRLQLPATGQANEILAYRSDRTPFIAEVRSLEMPSLGAGIRVAVLRDVTEHRRLEDELRQAQKMDAVGRLAGGIAHDFNNVLTVILGTCDLASPESFDEDIEQIRLAAQQASDMTGQLLAFSRQQRLELEVLDLNGVVSETGPLLRRLLPEHIELRTDLDPELERIEADRSQLAQVLMNLVINARDAMPAGGRLCLVTRHLPPGVAGPAAVARLEVSDDGAGISPEHLDQIFEPFFTTKERGRGTGLGLATVHGIVRQLGGDIAIDSELGVGTRVRVDFPGAGCSHQAAGTGLAPGQAQAEPLGSGTVLVIEDQVEICELIDRFLSAAGFDVVCANGGAQAFELAGELEQPAVLLLVDVVLPHVGGPEVAARLRQKWPDVKTLFMSGYSEGPWIEAIRGDPMLEKPFGRRRLLEKISEVLADAAAP